MQGKFHSKNIKQGGMSSVKNNCLKISENEIAKGLPKTCTQVLVSSHNLSSISTTCARFLVDTGTT